MASSFAHLRLAIPLASAERIPTPSCRLFNRSYEIYLRSGPAWRLARAYHHRHMHGCSVTCSSTTELSAVEQDAAALVSWLQANGAMTRGVRVAADSRGGLGLVAAANCQKGQRLMQLPARVQLTRGKESQEDAFAAPLEAISSTIPEPLWALQLGLKVLNERARHGSFWWPYIRCLPQRFTVPIFFSPAAIAELHYPPLVEQVKMRSRFLVRLSQELIPAVLQKFPPEQHPFAAGQQVDTGALAWAMAAVSSRAFRPRGLSQPAALLPLVDMANHSSTPNALLRALETTNDGTVEMVALCDMLEGTPVELSYGSLSNDFFLLDYGFVEEQCSHDRVELRFQLSLLETAREIARVPQPGYSPEALEAVFTQLHLSGPGSNVLVTLGGSECVDNRLLAAVRSMYGSVEGVKLQDLQEWGEVPPLGREAEEKALRTLIGLCLLMEAQLPPVPTDSLVREKLPMDVQLALTFRAEKRSIVIKALRFLKEKLEQLKQ